MGTLLRREPKRVLREIKTTGGETLRVVAYRIPEPSYRNEGCGPRTTLSAHPDDLVEGMFAACVENQHFAAVLEALLPGLPADIAIDNAIGAGPNLTGGNLLTVLLMQAQQRGLLPLLLRATEIRDQGAVERFVAGWRDEAQHPDMRLAAAMLLTIRDAEGDRRLTVELRKWGVTIRHLERKAKDGSTMREEVSIARRQLRQIIDTSSRISGG